ncbi:phosphoenolpyruvate-protein phosphotransferase [Ralstonia solanacearum]|nr:phosphoenolpyruvate-protein phosphotransferase [Ralstonia solanacearum]
MGKKTLTNAQSLLELIERAPISVLRTFSGLPECQTLARGFHWSQEEAILPAALLEHVRHLRRDQRDPAEREALRVLRLASPRGAAILVSVADQLNDSDLIAVFMSQDGGEFGRAIWMRTHSDTTARLFEVAESILNTGDIRGNKRLYDAFDVPCDNAPPFLWSDKVKKELETQLTRAMRLTEPCEVVHVALADESGQADTPAVHYLVIRFTGDQVTAVQVINRNRRSFCYFPARDATLVYVPARKVVEVYAHTLSTRAPLVNVLSAHGFKAPLSNRPLNRSRYDLSRFARPLKDEKPRLDGAKVERLYLTEARALLGHATDAVSLHIDSGADLHDVIGERWGSHPFSQPGAILGVTLVADLVFAGDTKVTPLSIMLAEPGRCSLQGERDPRLRQAGTQLLEALGVLKPLHPGSGVNDPGLIVQVARLLECASSPMDGFALAQLGIDIERFEDEGILTEGERITEKVVDLADGERFTVQLERCADPNLVRYRDPLTGNDIVLPAKHARRWKVHLNWLREEIITALGTALQGVRGKHLEEEPVFLGELDIDGFPVALYFAARMGNERQYARVDTALRLRPRAVPGIVLTTTPMPFPFAGTNMVIAIEDVLADGQSATAIDTARLKTVYRHGQQAAMGGTAISLKVSADGYAAVLSIPGKAPWRVTGQGKIAVLQRLVDAYAAGTSHVNTKRLMEGTQCGSPANLFSKTSPWRDYLVKVAGAHAWQLNLPTLDAALEDEATEAEALPG